MSVAASPLFATLLLLAAPLILLLQPATCAHLPPEYLVCNRNDPNLSECLKKVLSVAVKNVASGIPSLGVVPVDPLNVPLLEISDGTSNINLKITFKDVRVTGLSKAIVGYGSLDLPNNKLNFGGVEPRIIFEADYTMKGKFLVVPVEGSGRCKFIFTNMSADLGLVSERRKTDGKDYWDVKEFHVNIDKLDLMEINFENLFNGDATLGPSFNRLLNENWQDFWGALRPTFEESFALIFKDFSYRVFQKVPLDEVFPPK